MRVEARFLTRDFSAPLAFPDVNIEVVRYSWHRKGGPEIAELRATGSSIALWEMANWLRAPVELIDERGEAVWWGYLAEISIGVGRAELGLSLDYMANRTRIQYSEQADGGTAIQKMTEWAEDWDSVACYGPFELVASLSNGGEAQALALRDGYLDKFRYPVPVIRHVSSSGTPGASLRCRGWWYSLAHAYYQNDATEAAETTAQIGTIGLQQRFIEAVDIRASSGVMVSQYRDGTEKALEIIEALLESGMSDGDHLCAIVTRDRTLRVYEEPIADVYYLEATGTVSDAWGNPIMDHTCPVANWCALKDVIPPTVNVSRLADATRFFVERSEYTTSDGRCILEPRGQPSPWTGSGISIGGTGACDLWIGRWEGPRVGLFRYENEDDGSFSIFFEADDTSNVPFMSVGERNYKSNSKWLRIGYADAKHIYLAASTGGENDAETHPDIVIPGDALTGVPNHDHSGDALDGGAFDPANLTSGKVRFTPEGGLAIKLTNKTGGATVKGYVVRANSALDNSFILCDIGGPDPFGVVYEAGVADAAECWVVVSGIAEVYFVGSTTAGQFARMCATGDTGEAAGQAIGEARPTAPFATDKHFQELGHVIETRTGAGLAKIVMHLN